MDIKERLADYAEMTEEALYKYLPEVECLQKNVIKAARYSLSAGGKRIRPALVMEFCRVCGDDPETALPIACAIEMLHTFSLIHDDLPCMDDDDLRRGKPSCHKAFGEATAVLAGDALAMLPFQVIAEAGLKKTLSQDAALKIIKLLGELSGVWGMIGGQTVDLENENKRPEVSVITEMYRMKTGALLEFCCRAGCIAAGAGADKQLAAGSYGQRLGLAFQIIDDILDVTSSADVLGKNVGSDSEHHKSTFMTFFDVDKAKEFAQRYTDEAKSKIAKYEGSDNLCALADYLCSREK